MKKILFVVSLLCVSHAVHAVEHRIQDYLAAAGIGAVSGSIHNVMDRYVSQQLTPMEVVVVGWSIAGSGYLVQQEFITQPNRYHDCAHALGAVCADIGFSISNREDDVNFTSAVRHAAVPLMIMAYRHVNKAISKDTKK